MSRIAGVYRSIQQAGQPWSSHPCVVVLEIDGTDECICIPSFTAGRDTVNKAIEYWVNQGVPREAVSVLMDNRQAVRYSAKYTAVEAAEWSILQVVRIERRLVDRSQRIGAMEPEYLLALYEGLIQFAQSTPGQGQFSAHLQKRIRKTAEKLRQRL